MYPFTMQNLTDHENLSSACCHVGLHVDFSSIQIPLVYEVLKVLFKVHLQCLWLLYQSHNLYVTGQGPSSSAIKRPFV